MPAPAGVLTVRRARANARLAPHHAGLVAVLAFAGALNLYALRQNGWGNLYYASAVKSMLTSWHDFLYVSFDSGGLVSVDKPPLALWVQAASAKVFGLSPLSLLVPQALAALAAVIVLYRILRPRFGAGAALLGAAALATFPAFVAIARNNGPDSLLICLLVLAAGTGLSAVDSGRARRLVLAAVLIGLAFNTKTLAALVVVPGIVGGWLALAPVPLRRRATGLAVAAVALVSVSAAWIVFVDLTPRSQRPYVGSSTDNSEVGLALGYNGAGRVIGQSGSTSSSSVGRPFPGPHGGNARVFGPTATSGNDFSAGRPGPFRLFNSQLGTQAAWLLVLAIGAGVAAMASVHSRGDRRLAALVVFGGWLAAEAVVLSFASGIVHPYYVSALAPAVGGLLAVGAGPLVALNAQRSARRRAIPVVTLAAAVAVQVGLLGHAGFLTWWIPVLVAASALAPALIVARPHPSATGMSAALVGLLVAPACFAATVWDGPADGTFPVAGSHVALPPGSVAPPLDRSLAAWLRVNHPGTRWPVLTQTAAEAAPLILDEGVRAGALGGFNGTDPSLSPAGLAARVRQGQARYVLLGGGFPGRVPSLSEQAVRRTCVPVAPEAWAGVASGVLSPRGGPVLAPATQVLYDCSGRAAGLSAA